jgi:ubiquinol-cytochrome c reductase cytochrome c subunit
VKAWARVVPCLAAGALTAACSVYQPPPVPRPAVPPGTADVGRSIFDQTCAGCHGPDARGTPRAPSLADAGSASVDFQLGTGRMPLGPDEQYRPVHQEPKLSPDEIDAVVGYLARLHPDGPPIPQVHPANLALGRQLYAQNCAACHSAGGTGGPLTDGRSAPDLRSATPTQVGEAIRVGPGVMPAFPPGVLSAEQVDGIAAYVNTLAGEHGDLDRGGLSLGRIGPLTEGLLVFAVGLPLLLLVCRRLGSRTK